MDIHIENLRFSWSESGFELNIPSWRIPAGRSVAIVGPSGSGKSTFLKLLAGIEQPCSGGIRFSSMPSHSGTEHERRAFRQGHIGFVFQDFRLVDYLDVQGNILIPWRLQESVAMSQELVHVRLKTLLQGLGLTALRHRPVHQLSHGERQRTAIARAMILQPKVVLADEPTGNLDPANKVIVRDMLLRETARTEATLIMVTHDRGLVEAFDEVQDFQAIRNAHQPSRTNS